MSIHVTGGAELEEAGTIREQKLEAALVAARRQLVTLGGNSANLDEPMARSYGVDMVHWSVLRLIDDALATA